MENQKTGWIDEIAAKSKYSVEQVKSVIQKYDIQQSPNIGMPKHLHIKEVKFSGVKDGIFSNEFNFNLASTDVNNCNGNVSTFRTAWPW